jgi:hypothetical protein
VLRTDNGPEFLGEAFTSWARNAGMAIPPHQALDMKDPRRSSRSSGLTCAESGGSIQMHTTHCSHRWWTTFSYELAHVWMLMGLFSRFLGWADDHRCFSSH